MASVSRTGMTSPRASIPLRRSDRAEGITHSVRWIAGRPTGACHVWPIGHREVALLADAGFGW